MTRRLTTSREVGGADPIDSRLGTPPLPAARLWRLLRGRAALGLAPAAAPAIVFVPLGVLLGPQALNLVPGAASAPLGTVVAVALAALGVFVGLALDVRVRLDRRLLAAASVEAVLTVAIVGGAFAILLSRWGMPLDTGLTAVALTLGIGAAASSAGSAEEAGDPAHQIATRVADLDDVLPIVAGGVVLALVHVDTAGRAVALAAGTIALGLGIAVAGWMLFERARGPAERGVFVIGTLLLLGGATSHLLLSPLLAGLVAGLFWTLAPGQAAIIIASHLRRIQHPLVVLLLIVAGATLEWSPAAAWLLGPFVLFRLAGKLTGGWMATQLVPRLTPADMGTLLIPPGVIGIAFTLNFHQIAPTPTGVALVTTVAVGSLLCELIALVTQPPREAP